MIDRTEVIQELETGTPSPMRRRYLIALLASADLEREPAGDDVDHQRSTETKADSVKMHRRQDSPRRPKTMECTNRHAHS